MLIQDCELVVVRPRLRSPHVVGRAKWEMQREKEKVIETHARIINSLPPSLPPSLSLSLFP